MGLILAGILVGAALFGLTCLYAEKSVQPNDTIGSVLLFFSIVTVVAGILLGILAPVSGFEEPKEVSTIELVSLKDNIVSEGKGGLFYVAISGTNSYTYYVKIDSPYASGSQKAYESKTISGGNIIVVEDDSFNDAKLVKYVREAKKSFWTFALMGEKYEYVFYVPSNTIVRDTSLG